MDQQAQPSHSYGSASAFVFAVFFAVAIPTTLTAFGGRWLDQRFGTRLLFTLFGLLLSLAISAVLVLRLAKRYKSRT